MKIIKLFLLYVAVQFLSGCAGKVIKQEPLLSVLITPGTVVTETRRDHIVAVSNKLCREAGRSGVETVVLDNKDRGLVTLAVYLCVGECSDIMTQDNCVPGQRRVLEEVVVPNKEENHYLTFRMLIESIQ